MDPALALREAGLVLDSATHHHHTIMRTMRKARSTDKDTRTIQMQHLFLSGIRRAMGCRWSAGRSLWLTVSATK
jgi:hypothetical protein